MTRLEVKRGKGSEGRRGSSRVRRRILPRLARWAGVGVFVFGGLLLSCDEGPTGDAGSERGFVYVLGDLEVMPQVQKFIAKTGEEKTSFFTRDGCISGDVDPDNGDVFAYTWNFLRRYDRTGEMVYEVRVQTERFNGREYIALNNKTDVIYFLDGLGKVWYYRGKDGERLGAFYTKLQDSEQLVVDESENTEWIVGNRGEVARKYSSDGYYMLVELADGPFTRIAVDDNSNTVLIGVVKGTRKYLARYTKRGTKKKEIPTGIAPRGLGVEPGSGNIWVSDGRAIERYAADGKKLPGFADVGFKYIDFTGDGAAAFAVDGEGYLYAVGARSLKILWREKRFSSWHDIHLLKYCDY
ncbi:MAG: hypothetical protein GTN49_05765 [candidate division Zixibacteria bacterium]|nr:hypothetical protein [candidate division Zixibacteria bacterium]